MTESATIVRGELHAHLNGSIPLSIVKKILAQEHAQIPSDFNLERDLFRHRPYPTLSDYLKPWQVLRLIPKRRENLDHICEAIFEGYAQNHVEFVEIRSTVLYLAALQVCRPADALAALLESFRAAALARGIRRGIVLTVTRGPSAVADLDTLLEAYRELGMPSDVVGVDLAGDEDVAYPEELPQRFQDARHRYGLGITIHAGETGNSRNIVDAVKIFGADRIGHGCAAGGDSEVLDLLANRDVCVEVCPISNRLTGALNGHQTHPLVEFRKRGVPFVICSDNPGIHGRGLGDDYAAAVEEGLAPEELAGQYEVAKKYSFLRGPA